MERSSAANQQKSVSDSLAKSIGNRLDNVARFVQSSSDVTKDSNKTLKNMDSTLDSMHKENVRSLQSIRDLLKNKGNLQPSAPKQSSITTKRDFFAKKEDKGWQKNIGDVEDILRGMAKKDKDDKEDKKKKGDGLIGGMAKFLAIGGLLGFMLTGKSEFLMDMVKSFKGIKVFADFFGTISKVGIGVSKIIGVLGGAEKLAKSAEGAVKTSKMFSGAFKSIGSAFSFMGKVGKGLGVGGKVLGKLGLKALKMIPGVGAILGLVFGIQRFSKGDVVGGLGEIASGLVGLIPGVGTVISMAIDSALMIRDFSNIKKPDKKGMFEGFGAFDKKTSTGAVPSSSTSTPNYNSNMASTVSAPSGTPSGQGDSNLLSETHGISNIPSKIPYNRTGFVSNNKKSPSMFSKVVRGVKKVAGEVARTATIAAGQTAEKGIGSGIETVTNRVGAGKNPYYLAGIKNDSVNGLKPGVWKNFLGMAKGFQAAYGIPLPVTSGWRSNEKQKKLYDEDLAKNGGTPSGTVAKPGRSMHEHGFAMDIGGRTQGTWYKNKLMEAVDPKTGKNLLETWGFWTPMDGKRTRIKEDWHIEPESIAPIYDIIRAGGITDFNAEAGEPAVAIAQPSGVPSGQGDRVEDVMSERFSPIGGRKIQMGAKNTPMTVALSQDDINKLAQAIGEQYKNAIPKPIPGRSSGGTIASSRI